LSTDGVERDVYEDAEGRQYDLDGERVDEQWLPPTNASLVAEGQQE